MSYYNDNQHHQKTSQTYYDPSRGAQVTRDVDINRKNGNLTYNVKETAKPVDNTYNTGYGYNTNSGRNIDVHRSDYNTGYGHTTGYNTAYNTGYNRNSYGHDSHYDSHHNNDGRTFGDKVKDFFHIKHPDHAHPSNQYDNRGSIQHREEHKVSTHPSLFGNTVTHREEHKVYNTPAPGYNNTGYNSVNHSTGYNSVNHSTGYNNQYDNRDYQTYNREHNLPPTNRTGYYQGPNTGYNTNYSNTHRY